MSIQSTEAQITSRSILHHRPISPDGITNEVPFVARASRGGTSQRHDKKQVTNTLQPSDSPHQGRHHGLVFVGMGMLLTMALVVLGQVIITWASITWDDLHYGRPRTYQIDAFVGHETAGQGKSHFIALNLHGHIEVIEFPGGDATHARIFIRAAALWQ